MLGHVWTHFLEKLHFRISSVIQWYISSSGTAIPNVYNVDKKRFNFSYIYLRIMINDLWLVDIFFWGIVIGWYWWCIKKNIDHAIMVKKSSRQWRSQPKIFGVAAARHQRKNWNFFMENSYKRNNHNHVIICKSN